MSSIDDPATERARSVAEDVMEIAARVERQRDEEKSRRQIKESVRVVALQVLTATRGLDPAERAELEALTTTIEAERQAEYAALVVRVDAAREAYGYRKPNRQSAASPAPPEPAPGGEPDASTDDTAHERHVLKFPRAVDPKDSPPKAR